MPRFFKENIASEPFLSGDDALHITKSLRMRVGEKLTVCDKNGTDYECSVSKITSDLVSLDIIGSKPNESEPDVKVTLFQCLPKADKMESVIKESVQLGVTEIVPVRSSRCISIPNDKALEGKLIRWQKISDEAAKQSGRGILPQVFPAVTYKNMLENLKDFDLALFLWESGGVPIKSILGDNKRIAVIVGPEGGFSVEEAEAAQNAGARVCSLGKRILRTETAPLAAIASVMILSGNME